MTTECPKGRTQRVFAYGVVLSLSVLIGACSVDERIKTEARLVEPPPGPLLHDVTPVRGTPGPLAYMEDEDSFPCSICHEGFDGDMAQEALENTHANITFDHGRNVRCLNCHNPANADVYADHDGSEISADEPTLLCSKCHGPHYREWTLDVHGRVGKYWDNRFGEQEKLACIQCHDPHRPRFQPMAPEPPPVLTRFDLEGTKGAHHE